MAQGKAADADTIRKFNDLIDQGTSVAAAARAVNQSERWGYRQHSKDGNSEALEAINELIRLAHKLANLLRSQAGESPAGR